MANELADETSPYLVQHAENPVDWRPWGEGAKRTARQHDIPLLVSIGYSSCHWCHVMEHESFTDAETAAYMNAHFVPVKVDREERPDVDAIYMEAVQGMTGHGGWPLTVFCDPDGVPFHGGTYFPPEPRQGMPSFMMVLEAVSDAWGKRREDIRAASVRTREQLGAIGRLQPADEAPDREILETALEALEHAVDPVNGGFGSAPKFPPASTLDLLLANGRTEPVELTLDAMAAGGIHDQLGGGFARYSVDAAWLVPHFEKMLYDNALLARTYLRSWQELGRDRDASVCRDILDWTLREMRGPEGGFFSALDADSEGVEGRFYVWSLAEAERVLAEAGLDRTEAAAVLDHYGVSAGGNFEGANILNLPAGADAPAPARLEEARQALLAAREDRVRPGLDDKRLTAWNALMMGAMAEAGAALGEERYLEAARGCGSFLLETMREGDGRLLRTYNAGEARLNAYLEDHAYLLEALITLYEATFEAPWYAAAVELADAMLDRFGDPVNGGFFTTSDDHEELVARRKDVDDHPAPSGNSAAARGLLRLAALSGERSYEDAAAATIKLLSGPAGSHPQALAYLLGAIDDYTSPRRELALVTPPDRPEAAAGLAAVARSGYRPGMVLAGGPAGASEPPLLADRGAAGEDAAAYLCERFACRAPVSEPAELERLLSGASSKP